MKYDYKSVQICADSNQNLISIPTGKSEKWGTLTIDSILELKIPYSDEQLEQELINSMDRCYSKVPNNDLKISDLENYLGIKGFAKACQGWYFSFGSRFRK
jgi:hypothetical protein